jgi:hypothetical protein
VTKARDEAVALARRWLDAPAGPRDPAYVSLTQHDVWKVCAALVGATSELAIVRGDLDKARTAGIETQAHLTRTQGERDKVERERDEMIHIRDKAWDHSTKVEAELANVRNNLALTKHELDFARRSEDLAHACTRKAEADLAAQTNERDVAVAALATFRESDNQIVAQMCKDRDAAVAARASMRDEARAMVAEARAQLAGAEVPRLKEINARLVVQCEQANARANRAETQLVAIREVNRQIQMERDRLAGKVRDITKVILPMETITPIKIHVTKPTAGITIKPYSEMFTISRAELDEATVRSEALAIVRLLHRRTPASTAAIIEATPLPAERTRDAITYAVTSGWARVIHHLTDLYETTPAGIAAIGGKS